MMIHHFVVVTDGAVRAETLTHWSAASSRETTKNKNKNKIICTASSSPQEATYMEDS